MFSEIIDRVVSWTATALLELWTISRRGMPFIKPLSLAYACGAYFLLGLAISKASIILFPQILIKNPLVSIGTFLAFPIVAGYVAKGLANFRTHQDRNTIPRDAFWKIFFLALGVGILRLI
jgi:hypothetical protein